MCILFRINEQFASVEARLRDPMKACLLAVGEKKLDSLREWIPEKDSVGLHDKSAPTICWTNVHQMFDCLKQKRTIEKFQR